MKQTQATMSGIIFINKLSYFFLLFIAIDHVFRINVS